MESITTGFEAYWFQFVDYWGEDFLLKYGTFFVHQIFYFAAYIPFFLCDFIPAFQKYKLQPTKRNDFKTQLNCLAKIFFTHVFVQLPMIIVFHPAIQMLGFRSRVPLPSLPNLIFVLAVSFLLEDFYFYWIHRLLHQGFWYKHIHKIHHDHSAPFGITAEYAHPIETLLLGVGTCLGPFLLTRDLFTLWSWLAIRLYQTVECHSGYDFPWNPTNFIPFWGGSHFHDFHHETFVGNYSSTFTYLDKLCGTSDKYYQRLTKRNENKEQKQK
ncbi:C-4 methyl sterol oxidase [Heterostelium album PN500]|uniref:C-4 methyl sterol oxidase n=1 Tax=Heterostelium pallidum (strain ATCC 26659 / Pp 5 / PN500) TaxID=670386 RepID=D3BIK0_HETP5|nr:C-4 methyl sterol oxidase [Heterostelium album PN500]EFA78624.1 C-4 methyl sterol oxidase [Heterostelium album PN500]|eukprot:XP_020430748.1 C-4 methyl sterol oxidase [Heterostelium album PN500]